MRAVVILMLLARLAAAEPTRDYVVRAGDTCVAIAIRELGDRGQLDALHRANPALGALPHNLKPGQILKLPTQRTSPDARLADQRGTVEVRPAGDERWVHAATGADLFRAWRVGARAHATAQVAFADRSAIAMRENTVVVIFGPSQADAKLHGFRASLEQGTLRSRLAELDGRATIESPGGITTLAGGSAVLDVDRAGTTWVSNHAGQPAEVRSRGARPATVKVSSGFGSQVAVGRSPTPPKALPAAPAWLAKPALVVGWAGRGGIVRGSWAAVPGARQYRLDLARDRALTSVDLHVELGGDATTLEAREVPAGLYWLSVAAVDAAGFESAPGEPAQVTVVEIALPTTTAAPANDVPRLALGARLPLPDGLRCGLDGEPPAPTLVARGAGPRQVTCVADATTATTTIDVAAARVVPAPPTILVDDRPAVIDVAIDASPQPEGTIVAAPWPGLAVDQIERTATGARLHVHATADAKPGPAHLTLSLAATATELGTSELELTRTAAPPVARHAEPWLAVSLIGTGANAPAGGESDLRFGANLSLAATRWLAADLGLWRSSANAGPTWASAGVTLGSIAPTGPFIRAGFLKTFDDADLGGYLGFGVVLRFAPRLSGLLLFDDVTEGTGQHLQAGAGLRLDLR